MTRGRMESFSDGVLAVAITLLILNISVPAPGSGHLGHDLGREWPQYVAYVTSFLTIGIIWINHHVAIGRLRTVDHTIMLLNLLLLMSVVALPFATNLMATYLREPSGQRLAAGVYAGALLLMGVLFVLLNRHILLVRPELLAHEISAEQRRTILVRNLAGITPYVIATAVAPLSAYATLIITSAVAVFYALPTASSAGT